MLNTIKNEGIVAVIRAKDHDEAKGYINACVNGGIRAVELTYSIPNVVDLINELSCDENLILGVGSVLNKKWLNMQF
ncbi:KDPG and KHG aldolase family protein [[Clostridium] sordellii ATCC 9714]|nr:KDPG and KHG aldolase family protein [[Clostridium] sordellii ATCC 9714] [Paeniclostridium sordellii ATCC 9714]